MLKLIKSGWAFTILALLFLALDLVFQSGSLFLILGIIFLGLAILMRARFRGEDSACPSFLNTSLRSSPPPTCLILRENH